MKSETKIGYTVLRYIHDITTQEFVNIGVLAYAPETPQLKLKCADQLRRVHSLFPDVDSKRLSNLIRHVQEAFDTYACQLSEGEAGESIPTEVMKAAARVLPSDSSSLQWSPPAGGYDVSLNEAVNKTFERYVLRHQQGTRPQRSKGINAVLKPFKRELQSRGVFDQIKPHTVKGAFERYDFSHTWKNDIYHCYEPVNLDLKNYMLVKARAMEWVGRATDLTQSQERLHLYLLLAQPTLPEMRNAYEDTAAGMKQLLPRNAEVVVQEEIVTFTHKVADSIEKHAADSALSD